MNKDIKTLCLDGIALSELIVAFTNRKDLADHVKIFFETNEALLILNSATSIIERSKGVDFNENNN